MGKSTEPALGGATGSFGPQALEQLRTFATRMLVPMNDMEAAKADLKEITKEAKDAGFDTKIVRKAIKELRSDAAAVAAEREQIDTVKLALGPLFDHADAREQRAAA